MPEPFDFTALLSDPTIVAKLRELMRQQALHNAQPMPLPDGSLPPAPIRNFNPDDPRDPAGPSSGGKRQGQFGSPTPAGNMRPMLKVGLFG